MKNFFDIIKNHPPSFVVIDVGAASMGPGTDAYDKLLGYAHINVIGFEPDEKNCKIRNDTSPENYTFFPYYVGDGQPGVFYQCQNPLTSSLYEPNLILLSKLHNMDLPVIDKINVETKTLDSITMIGDADYLKIDVQGAELDVLNGAGKLLSNVTVVHTEVEFVPLYKNQPLFGDIDMKLRQHGFLLYKFVKLFSRQFSPLVIDSNPPNKVGQLLFAEGAVYIRDFTNLSILSPDKLLNLASILHDVYSSIDMVVLVLTEYDRQCETDYTKDYMLYLRECDFTQLKSMISRRME